MNNLGKEQINRKQFENWEATATALVGVLITILAIGIVTNLPEVASHAAHFVAESGE